MGWNPGLYGADERWGADGRGGVDKGGDIIGEGEGLDETDAGENCGGTTKEVERGGAWPEDWEELGVCDGL